MAKKKAAKKKLSKSSICKPSTNWVDRLEFEAVNESDAEKLDIRIVSWNVLAQAYLTRQSHRNLPKAYEDVVFKPNRRAFLMEKVLRKLIAMELDVLCLQEVDLPLIETVLAEESFTGVSTPTTNGGGAGGRVDACCIYWNNHDWKMLNQDLICFDDLSTLGSNATKLESNLHGVKQSLLRRNVAILVRLQHRNTSTKLVVCSSHLYWNPEYDYVKLCQAHYAMVRTHAFAEGDPIVFCGDLNSKPHGPVHEYLTRGTVNAKLVAPWYNNPRRDDETATTDVAVKPMVSVGDDIVDQFDGLQIQDTRPPIQYMLDFTLNRFSRWLRILGVDAALETDQEEIQRTKHGKPEIFDRCRSEGRTLITTSSKLMLRKDCPPGAYLINPKTLGNLEASLVHLLLSHGVVLEPQSFLSRCVVCNGNIRDVTDKDERRRVFAAHQVLEVADDLECYACDGCGQGYWWCDRPTSSATRVKGQATRLFELCLRGGVEIKGPLSMFDNVDVDAERRKPLDIGIEMETLQVLEWLKQEMLQCPVHLESSYALRDEHGVIVGECKPFTNVTSDFVGFLDYVLFEPAHFQLNGRLYLPASFKDLNSNTSLRNGHLLPSFAWPSDHLAVGAELSIPTPSEPDAQDTAGEQLSGTVGSDANVSVPYCGILGDGSELHNNDSPPPALPIAHNPRCGCGCVPNILSLFEMAELRKQARLRTKQVQEEKA